MYLRRTACALSYSHSSLGVRKRNIDSLREPAQDSRIYVPGKLRSREYKDLTGLRDDPVHLLQHLADDLVN